MISFRLPSEGFAALALGALLALGLSACATTGPVDVSLPMNQLDSPESSGQFPHGHFGVGHRSSQKITVTPNYGTTPIAGNAASLASVATFGGDLGFGVLDRLDGDLKIIGNGLVMIQAKYQVLGEPRLSSKAGNGSLSFAIGYGGTSQEKSGTDSIALFGGTPGPIARYQLDARLVDFKAIGGYRVLDPLLLYVGLTAGFFSYEGDQTVFNGTLTKFSYSGHRVLHHLGLIVSSPSEPSYFAQLEATAGFLQAQGAQIWRLNGALNFGILW